ncbi:4Fe-4S ferredoxin [Campylobacter mucosalis]|uniref:4Fe-4S binding protein n=1 Tax=Campylobacter mucosalis TaxID=202 RepID=UPI0004DAE23A|nr:4Fe-4S binding protein [Campylobacter mucosalis]KEA46218.1 4Fe-4S ferredoxin [Campylobacter mucosalis]QKF62675.1 ferredoxin-type protein [Campylobacter mucosalis]
MQRRELFAKILKPKADIPNAILPPYFGGKFDCDECDAPCIKACDKGLLSFKNQQIEFAPNARGCDFCEACALACSLKERTTLSLQNEARILAKVSISTSSCLAWNETICYSCMDACRYKAIDFFGVFRPLVNSKCIGCGECVGACFKGSITMERL